MNKTVKADQEIFYNSASEFYDDMISFPSSLERRREWFKTVLDPDVKKAADLGCGSGLDSIALGQLGLEVTGFDISEGMIAQAMKNAQLHNVRAQFQISEIQDIGEQYHNSFHLITSLGNTIANVEPVKLVPSFQKIYRMLLPGGKYLMQILNYEVILNERERIVNINKSGQFTYIRFYDFYADHLDFNILKYDTQNTASRNLLTTTIYPYLYDHLVNLLQEAGFAGIRTFGSLKMDPFKKDSSKDLIVSAEKQIM